MTGPGGRPDDDRASPVSPAPHYAEPVDPWATAEAASLAADGGVPPAVPWAWPPPAAPGRSRRPYPRNVLCAAAIVVVAGLAATLLVVLWPRDRALEFTPLADVRHIRSEVEVTSNFSDAEITRGRAYFASTDDAGTLGVVAVDVASGKQLWRSTSAGTAARWDHMVALPYGLAAFTGTVSETGKRRMAMLGADRGDLLWDRTIDDRDEVFFVADVAVLVDRAGNRLLGLELAGRGKTRWEIPNIKADYGTATAIVPVTTTDDLSGPAGVDGEALASNPDDDKRLVQISADRSARVIDAGSGDIVRPPRSSVADTDDEVVAHNGRLFVRESGNAQRILAYDLGKLGEPAVLYTAGNANRQLTHLAPCGPDRVCFVETDGYDAKTARVVSVDAARNGHWTRSMPNAETLVPIGDSVLVSGGTSPAKVSLLDARGNVTWTRDGEAARLNRGNMLLFLKPLSTYPDDSFVWGDHTGDDVVPLGALSAVRSATCSWDTAMLACVGDKDFVMQRFAE